MGFKFKEEFYEWYNDQIKKGYVKGFSVRAFNCLNRSICHIRDLNQPALNILASLEDDEIIRMRNVGQRTFRELKELRDLAKKQVALSKMKEYIVIYGDLCCVIDLAESNLEEAMTWRKWYIENRRSGRLLYFNTEGQYYILVIWAESPLEAMKSFIKIQEEEKEYFV